MQAVIAGDQESGVSELSVAEVPYPHAAENDVIVRVHAASFTPGDPSWLNLVHTVVRVDRGEGLVEVLG
jgi:NADPH:quinone reductase-like Zn-dependent oxidoreductase